MTIRVLIFQKHNITRKIYSKQAGAPAPAPPIKYKQSVYVFIPTYTLYFAPLYQNIIYALSNCCFIFLTSFSSEFTRINKSSFSFSTFRALSYFRDKSKCPSAIILIFLLVSFSNDNSKFLVCNLTSCSSAYIDSSNS